MDLNYASGSESDEQHPVKKAKTSSALVNCAPGVVDDLSAQSYIDPTSKELISNPRAEALWRPVEGPSHPFKATNIGHSQGVTQNAVTGFVEKTAMNEYSFDEQYNTFQRFGFAKDPSENSGRSFVGNTEKMNQYQGKSFTAIQRVPKTRDQRERRRKRKEESCDVENVDEFQGPWASYYHEEEEAPQVPTEEQKEWAAKIEEKKKNRRRGEMGGEAAAAALEEEEEEWETSTFHGKELYDYQGRSYVHCPSNVKPRAPNMQCYIPKKCIHTWAGHSKGVSSIKFFPHTGHLLLSSSMDGTCKIWDVHNQRQCLRTYEGHTEAVRTCDFSPDGKKFISCSYDRFVKVWDTETGQCISRHTTKKIPFCVKWFPEEGGHDHEFLCGQSNKMVVQWDTREKKVVQQYDEHLGPVNSITFLDNNRRFLSSSDDKKILIWEYGIPVVVKHLAEPDMHSMPFTIAHPNGKFFLGQSQDNQILVHSASGRYKLNTKKRFRGHLTAGYACQIDFSPDGKYVMSGDASGRVFFWEWRTSRVFSKFKAHDKVTIGATWHPLEASKVATCSWDGTIKYWD